VAAPSALPPLLEVELVGRLALSAALAGLLGWERQLGNQPAGLRTHMLVALGAAAYTVAGTVGVAGYGTVQDAGRVAAQVVTGIGFVGAGTIWRSSGDARLIRGLTTAASIWAAGSIGMLCGFGLYILAAGCAVLCFVILRLLKGLERAPGVLWGQIAAQRRRATAPSPSVRGAHALPGNAVVVARPNGSVAGADVQSEAQPESDDAGTTAAEPQPARAGQATGKRKGKKRSRRAQRARTEDEISDEWQEVPAVAGRTAA
jgi:putative Mg2+ transporter-C (MgtC) family protein